MWEQVQSMRKKIPHTNYFPIYHPHPLLVAVNKSPMVIISTCTLRDLKGTTEGLWRGGKQKPTFSKFIDLIAESIDFTTPAIDPVT